MKRQLESIAAQAAQLAADRAPKKREEQVAPPPGMDPTFYSAMVSAGAQPHAPAAPSSTDSMVIRPNGVTLGDVRTMPIMDLIAKEHGPLSAPQTPQAAPPPTLAPPPPVALPTPPVAPSQPAMPAFTPPPPASIAPHAPAMANINNNVTMPTATFTPAQERPGLPTFQHASLIPNLGSYAPSPSMPGYGMPRTGQPFRPAAASQGLPTFANFGGQNPAQGQPTPKPLPDLYGDNGMYRYAPNLFNRY